MEHITDKKHPGPDTGLFFLFLLVIYLIALIKISQSGAIRNDLFFGMYSLCITVYIFSRFVLSYFHTSVPFDPHYEPTVAFVIPAKNEEDNIYETLMCCARSSYPKEKMEIITINDGSTDQTLAQMYRAEQDIREMGVDITVVDWQINRGKRDGMAEGTRMATNEIIFFVDSDSFVEPDCLRNLVKYFSLERIGAVSGHTDVANRDTNLLTQMQAVRYYIAFKIYKAAESIFGVVTCCPGCCSAYRRSYVMEFLDEWQHQRFMGKECTFGDDRSLTNFIIRKYDATYSADALARTVVPETFGKYMKQQQRWKKSWIRETFIACSFIWKKNPLAAFFFYTYVFLALASPIVFIRAVIWHPFIYHNLPVAYFVGLFLMLLMHGLYYRMEVGKKSWFLAIISFWFNTVILIWQLPWAFVTMADTRWGTR